MVNSRNKGNSFEREIAQLLRPLFPYIKTSRASSKLADDCCIDLIGCGNLAPQLKRNRVYKSPNEVLKIDHERYLRECGLPATKMIPLLITKADQKPVMVTLMMDDFFPMLQKMYAA